MKLYSLALLLGSIIAASEALSQVAANEESKFLLRVFVTQADCTVTKEGQCDGQNWIGSTCCADSSYECRWDDNGQDVKRCQQITKGNQVNQGTVVDTAQVQSHREDAHGGADVNGPAQVHTPKQDDEDSESDDSDDEERQTLTTESSIASSTLIQPGASAKFVDVWAPCTRGKSCKDGAECVRHSVYYSQCKPQMLPTGALCGQRDGVNVWFYDRCPAGEACKPIDSAGFRCVTAHHHKKAKHHHQTRGKQQRDHE